MSSSTSFTSKPAKSGFQSRGSQSTNWRTAAQPEPDADGWSSVSHQKKPTITVVLSQGPRSKPVEQSGRTPSRSQTTNWRTEPKPAPRPVPEPDADGWTSVSHQKKPTVSVVLSQGPRSHKPAVPTAPTDSRYHKIANALGDIKHWAKGKFEASEMLAFRKIADWTSGKSEAHNRLTMIKELAKNLRHDVLTLLIERFPKFSENLPLKGFTPLQHVVYPNRSVGPIARFENVHATSQVLIERYGFRLFTSCEDEELEKETVYGALLATTNPLNASTRSAFYTYLTQEAPIDWYLPDFRSKLNKLGTQTVAQFHNKLLMVTCRFPEQIANVMFAQLMSGRAPRIERLTQAVMICNALLTPPNDVDRELDSFFATIDVHSKLRETVDVFVANGHRWAADEASGLSEGSEEHSDRIGLNTRIYYAALGCMYSLGYAKEAILDIMWQQVTQSIRPIWLVRAIAMFLVHANIGITTPVKNELGLLREFLTTCYDSAPIKDKFDIENGLNVDYKQIKAFLSPVDVPVATASVEPRADEPDWETIMATVGDDEIADFD